MPNVPLLHSESITQAQRSVVARFQSLEDWMARYEYLIELGRSLPAFPDMLRTDVNRLRGCQGSVWMVAEQREGRLYFQASSDSAIVAGLIALLLMIYSGRTPGEILASCPDFFREIGLHQHLSPHRANGLAHMLVRIETAARTALDMQGEGTMP